MSQNGDKLRKLASAIASIPSKLDLSTALPEITSIVERSAMAQVISQGSRGGDSYPAPAKSTIQARRRRGITSTKRFIATGRFLSFLGKNATATIINGGKTIRISFSGDQSLVNIGEIAESRSNTQVIELTEQDRNEIRQVAARVVIEQAKQIIKEVLR